MTSVGGSVRMAQASNYIIQGSKFDDLLVYTATSNQNIVFGASNSSNMLFKIASNGFVGVGVSNPGFNLDVAGDLNFSGTLRQGGVPYVGSQWSNNTSNVFLIGSNVGIGLSNAGAALHVACNVRVDGALQLSSYAQFGGVDLMYGSGAFSNAGGVILTTSNIQGYSNLRWGASGSNGTQFSIMSNTSNDGFRWVSGVTSNELMKLTGEGNLGIGVSNPIGDLQIGQPGTNSNHIVFEGGNSVDGTLPGISAINFNGYYNGGRARINGGKNLWRMYVNQQSTSDSFGLETWNGTTATNLLFAQSNGNIGIGNAAPSFALDVSGTGRFTGAVGTGALTVSSGDITTSNGGIVLSNIVNVYPVGSNLNIKHNSLAFSGYAIQQDAAGKTGFAGGALYATNGGNVGIGTSNASLPLHVSGPGQQLALSTSAAGGAFLTIYGGDSNYGAAVCSSNSTAIRFGQIPTIGGTMTEYMRINSNGNVGINTATPAYTLDVNGYTRTKTVAFLAYCYGGPTVANAAGWFLVPMNNATYNYNATLSIPYNGNQPGSFGCPWTVTVAGVYDIKIKVTCAAGGWTTQNVGYSVNNASSVGVQSSVYVGSSVGSFTTVLNVNDVVRVWYYQSGGAGYMNAWGDSTTTFFACTLLAAL